MANSKDTIKAEGIVQEALPAGTFRVRLDDDRLVMGHLSGKIRMYRIKVVPGDKVTIEFSPYDKDRGRITRRM
ncbi:MAG: translation initiation factor IF-1 [Candidatus Harrisonbacteria bacterium CG10_big_fil_rev_8_21_14_0_10_49_15]|uniref:Translation initiation factor IF-1 n=1 Tax=Candidatus Harrisonbacteria bacterium CG10_big_fil_rev_8_21_14_0_10_49_15 TaxID=1974587 RepID=A0A2H0UJR4_9BACT|nr:MAG: translation initiation factor IF-1 [Candidatus Harrisonbacteria bacterium CG10_big_fil_rev_8_21_14_0_10_49_15]